MKNLIAAVVCILIFIVWALISLALGSKHLGGVIPMVLLFLLIGWVWRVMTKDESSKNMKPSSQQPNYVPAMALKSGDKSTCVTPTQSSNTAPANKKEKNIIIPAASGESPAVKNGNNVLSKKPNLVGVDMNTLEDWAYERVAEELETNAMEKGTWTKAYAMSGGDEKETKLVYIKLRVEKLIAQESIRLEQERSAAIERDIAERNEAERIQAEDKRLELITMRHKIQESKGQLLDIDPATRANFIANCIWGELDKIEDLLGKFPILAAASNSDGETGLHIAVRMENAALINLLMQHGANPLQQDNSGVAAFNISESAPVEVRNLINQFEGDVREDRLKATYVSGGVLGKDDVEYH